MKGIFSVKKFFLLIVLFVSSFLYSAEQLEYEEATSLLQAFMTGDMAINQDGTASFKHYQDSDKTYERSQKDVCIIIDKFYSQAWFLVTGWHTTPFVRKLAIAFDPSYQLTDEEREELIKELSEEKNKFEIAFQQFNNFVSTALSTYEDKNALIEQLKSLDQDDFKGICSKKYSPEECVDKIIECSESRRNLLKAIGSQDTEKINEAYKKQISIKKIIPVNKLIDDIKKGLNDKK
jgi:hypothetical protein